MIEVSDQKHPTVTVGQSFLGFMARSATKTSLALSSMLEATPEYFKGFERVYSPPTKFGPSGRECRKGRGSRRTDFESDESAIVDE